MKRTSKIVALCMALFVGYAFTIPATIGTLESHAAAKVKISKTKATIKQGQTLQLKMKGTKKKAKWSSSKKSIATVNKKGKVTAKNPGKTVITAKIGKKKYKCKITVKKALIVKLNKTRVTLNVGESTQLIVSTNGKSNLVTWKTSDSNIASVTGGGVVHANGVGTATITATCNGVSVRCKVTVTASGGSIGSRTNPANLANGTTVNMPDGTAHIKLDKTLKGDAAIAQLSNMGQWDDWATEEYKANPNTQVVYFEYTVRATSGFSSHPLMGLDIINPYGLYNSTCSANISSMESLYMRGAYDAQDYVDLTLYGGASSKMYMVLFVPNGMNSFTYPISQADYSEFWTKYAF